MRAWALETNPQTTASIAPGTLAVVLLDVFREIIAGEHNSCVLNNQGVILNSSFKLVFLGSIVTHRVHGVIITPLSAETTEDVLPYFN